MLSEHNMAGQEHSPHSPSVRTKKLSLIAFVVIMLVGATFFISERRARVPVEKEESIVSENVYRKATVSLRGQTWSALVADTPELRTQGLSGMPDLQKDEVMLFIFEIPELSGFWMKDMLFPIDIVWVGENGRIITTVEGVLPESFPETFFPSRPAKYVLEFRAGTIQAISAREGDLVTISNESAVGK